MYQKKLKSFSKDAEKVFNKNKAFVLKQIG